MTQEKDKWIEWIETREWNIEWNTEWNTDINNQIDKEKLKNELKLIFTEDCPENPETILTSTRWKNEEKDYKYALTHAQPEDRWLWYREVFTKKLMSEEQQSKFVWILKEAIKTKDPNFIREVVKTGFRYLWTKMWTWFTHDEIEEIVNSLDSFKNPLIVPVEKLWDEWIYLINESTWPTDAFKDLALQQVTTMLAIITRKKNIKAVKQAIKEKKEWISYEFKHNWGWDEKLVKYEKGWKEAENQWDRPKISIVITQTSTSWDTWPAWWSWIEWKRFVANIIFFPWLEATQWQIWQMLRLKWNVISKAINKAFSEIQEKMKNCNTPEFKKQLHKIVEDKFRDLREEYGFDIDVSSWSFNSVNIWRIDWQSIYHSLALMIAKAQNPEINWDVNEAIPSWNFWHTTWVLQAKDMMWWIDNIIVSTNENDAIYKLIKTWKYQMALEEISSPSISMIIRYWSNVERNLRKITTPERCDELMKKFEFDWKIFEIFEKYIYEDNSDKIQSEIELIERKENKKFEWLYNYFMTNYNKLYNEKVNHNRKKQYNIFKNNSWIQLNKNEHQKLKDLWLEAYRVVSALELETIRKVWLKHDRLICPHTANAYYAAEQYKKENPNDTKPILVSETASPWKFLTSLAVALTYEDKDLMAQEYERLRETENTKEWKDELMKMIIQAFKDNSKEFNEEMIPEDLREIYEKWIADFEMYYPEDINQLTLDWVDKIWEIFVEDIEDFIEKEWVL